jgi:hypothetical protein
MTGPWAEGRRLTSQRTFGRHTNPGSNLVVYRTTGEHTVELSFAALEWPDAVAICSKIRKLATEEKPPAKAVEFS